MPYQAPPEANRKPSPCERCLQSKIDVKYDLPLQKRLCNECWADQPPVQPYPKNRIRSYYA